MIEAISPLYPVSRQIAKIDLNHLSGEGSGFLTAARDTIRQRVARLYEAGSEVHDVGHVSLFAIAPIPVLIFLGTQLSNKIALDVYQRHRDTENWNWKDDGTSVEFEFRQLRQGTDSQSVALLLSLSGSIPINKLPAAMDQRFSVYELTLTGIPPNPTFLRNRRDLGNFRVAYQTGLARIANNHNGLKTLHLFPAVPAPIAVLCGRELLPKVHPELAVYDYDRATDGFQLQASVNENEN